MSAVKSVIQNRIPVCNCGEGEKFKQNDLDIHFFVILTRADRLRPDVKSGHILDRAYYRSAYLFPSGHFLSDSETFTQPDTAHNAF